ncbi:MAG: type secretion protein [Gammaproteobacteria bacterium]|jgi:type IV secretion system protein VirB10|nr:type secretion protein [Gammaproteobacteria bacterium]
MSEDRKKPPMGESVRSNTPPRVAGPMAVGKYLTVILMAIFAAILGRNFWTESPSEKKNQEVLVKPAADATTPAPQLNLQITPADYAASLPILPPPAKPLPLPPPVSVLPTMERDSFTKQAEETRRKSPTMVYGEKSAETTRSVMGAGSGDSNANFLQQAANAQVVTVSARHDTKARYKILQGKLIGAVLETAIDSDLPGMVRAVITKDIYGDTGEIVLLPRGTRLVGQYSSSIAVGQTRAIVIWTRAITPNYVDIALGSPNTDQLGQAGMGGNVDTHFWQIFGNSALLSVLGVTASSVNTGPNQNQLTGNPYQAAVSQGVLNASTNVLQTRINIQPTIRIPQGSLIQVFVARDLDFSTVSSQARTW